MPKQKELEGMEKPSIPEIEEAADAYVSIRDKRMAMTEKEVAAKTNLLQVLLSHESELSPGEDGSKLYRFDDEIVLLKPGKRVVKVKSAHEDEESEDDD
jgi:hypothetical protein